MNTYTNVTVTGEDAFVAIADCADRVESRITNGRLWHIAYRGRKAYWWCEGTCC